MMPRTALDIPVVEPSTASQQRKRGRSGDHAISKNKRGGGGGGGLPEWRGPCCGGTMSWGKGRGYDDGKGGRVWKCGNSSCNKLLPRPTNCEARDEWGPEGALLDEACRVAEQTFAERQAPRE